MLEHQCHVWLLLSSVGPRWWRRSGVCPSIHTCEYCKNSAGAETNPVQARSAILMIFWRSYLSYKQGWKDWQMQPEMLHAQKPWSSGKEGRRRHSSSGSDSSSSSDQHKMKHNRSGKWKTQKYSSHGTKPFQQKGVSVLQMWQLWTCSAKLPDNAKELEISGTITWILEILILR